MFTCLMVAFFDFFLIGNGASFVSRIMKIKHATTAHLQPGNYLSVVMTSSPDVLQPKLA